MNKKKGILFFVSIVTLLSAFSCAKSHPQTAHQAKGVDDHINSIIQPLIDSSKIAGTTIGVAKGNKILFLKSYGFSDIETKSPLSTDATFEIASITKPFTAIAILQLAEKGLLGLDDDIRKYIKFNSKGRGVTVRQLLDHTSGIKITPGQAFQASLKELSTLKTLLFGCLRRRRLNLSLAQP